MLFLVLEDENGNHQYEGLDTEDFDEAMKIAKEALEDAPVTYIYPSYNDDKYGLQPATHLDYICRFGIDKKEYEGGKMIQITPTHIKSSWREIHEKENRMIVKDGIHDGVDEFNCRVIEKVKLTGRREYLMAVNFTTSDGSDVAEWLRKMGYVITGNGTQGKYGYADTNAMKLDTIKLGKDMLDKLQDKVFETGAFASNEEAFEWLSDNGFYSSGIMLRVFSNGCVDQIGPLTDVQIQTQKETGCGDCGGS